LKDGLSIIIPAYNEEKTLAASVESACAAAIASGSDFEVLIVNDCSTDQTALVAAEVESTNPRVRALSNPTNLGMGGAFKTGLREANYSHAMVFPADNEHPVDGVLPILQARGKADIIIPFVTNPEIRARHRRVISWCYVTLVNLLFGQKIPYYNGLVLQRTDFLRSISIETNSFSFQTEAILKLLKKKASWVAIGVPLHQPSHSKTKAFRLKNVFGVMGTLMRLFINQFK
jgi:glycosyltransferase involved in cell wall biosynthesis